MESLETFPIKNQQELIRISDIIKSRAEVEMIILFGSHARGDSVADSYREGHITYEYLSDYDILVAVKSEKIEKSYGIWNEIEKTIREDPTIETPVSLIIDTIHFVNKKLNEGNYFYTDIKREGIVLYDSLNFKLAESNALSETEKKFLKNRDFDFWFAKAQAFKKDYLHNIEDGELNNAAFHLHQVAEALYVGVLLVHTGYKPKTHNLEKIENLVAEFLPVVKSAFPRITDKDKKLFEILRSSYTEARYNMGFKIKKSDLKSLFEGVQKLEDFVNTYCTNYLAG